jgi:hypothetical protein
MTDRRTKRMIRRFSLILPLLVFAGVMVYAQDKKSAQVTGFLVDSMCATGKDVKDKEHPVSCALMPKCQESGYAVVARDTAFKLDANGNKLALEILKNTKAKKGLAVTVKGTVIDDVFHVDTMTEVPQG